MTSPSGSWIQRSFWQSGVLGKRSACTLDVAGAMNITLDQIRECYRQRVSDKSGLHCFPKGDADGVNWWCLLSCNKGPALYFTTAVIVWVIWVIKVRIQRSFSSAVIVRKRIVTGGFLR
jgi:hypothetical protein